MAPLGWGRFMTVVLSLERFAHHTAVTRSEDTCRLCVEFLVFTTRVAWYRTHPDSQRRSTAWRGVALTTQAPGMMPLSALGIDASQSSI